MRVSVIGQGYVGLVTAACLAEWGHDVLGVDADESRLEGLDEGRLPIHEPGLPELVERGVGSGRLRFATPSPSAVSSAQVVFVAVGTHDGAGGWQTMTIRTTIASIAPDLAEDATLVVRSTLPPDFVRRLANLVNEPRELAGRRPVAVMTNPEFTREGAAVRDFLEPDRVVFGVCDDPVGRGKSMLRKVYHTTEAPVLVMSATDAALTKLGSNLFLATKISFANELAQLCDAYGADVAHVVAGMSYDARVGRGFMGAGVGFGGSCLPHQVTMTVRDSETLGISTPLFAAVEEVNDRQRRAFVDRLIAATQGATKPRVALLGLTFKPGTDDMREAPSLEIARMLIDAGIRVTAYDPMEAARARASQIIPALAVVDRASKAIMNTDAIGIVTEWPEFGKLPWAAIAKAVRQPIIVDGRNCLDPVAMALAGFDYIGFGRSARSVPVEEGGREEAGAASVVRERTLPTRPGYPVERLVHRGAESRVSEA